MSMFSTSFVKRIRLIFLKIVLAPVGLLLLSSLTFKRFGERIRSSLLRATLSLIYLLVLTPIAYKMRMNPERHMSSWNERTARSGWNPNVQSTSAPQIIRISSSSRDELAALTREKGNDTCALLVYDILRPLEFLARPPKEKELSADLYKMF
jgi:hypothetical protein